MTTDDRAPSPTEVDQLADLLETVSQRLAALDQPSSGLAGDGPAATENRSIRGAKAHFARVETRALRAEVAEVRRRAQEMAVAARRTQDRAHRLGPGRLEADEVPTSALARVCRYALRVATPVCWAQIAVPVRNGTTVTSSTGALADAAVEAVARGPRATAGRSGVPVVVDDVAADTRWPGLQVGAGAPASLLVVPLGPATGTLSLAAEVPAAFGPAERAVASEVARHAARLLAAQEHAGGPTDPAGRARDLVVVARALLARHEQVAPDAAFELLLERADRDGETLLACAEQVLDELGGFPAGDEVRPPEPATLRRAIAYLEEHATEDVDVVDVAAAAGLGVRGLQMVFRRWRDTTPLSYLRDVRLARAHQELRAADPRTGGETVADIAARWRFTHPGRFSVTYRERYGCSPSETLRA